MDSAADGLVRTYVIRRSHHVGFGFVAGHEYPTIVKEIHRDGPSFKRLKAGDVILAINGISTENASQDEIVKMIKLCDVIEIKVKSLAFEELLVSGKLTDPGLCPLSRSTNSLNANGAHNPSNRQAPQLPPMNNYHNPSPFNRLITSISQQQHPQPHHPPSASPFNNASSHDAKPYVQPRPKSNAVLRQQPNNGTETDTTHPGGANNGPTYTMSRNHANYGRHSPLPQRCKSSIDKTQTLRPNKKSGDADNDQPLLKRSNTMRPIRLPTKVVEIFEVVTKIFFEVGHTRVLKYTPSTTVAEILETLNARMTGDSPHSGQIASYFGLALTVGVHTETGPKDQPKRKLLHILNENDSIEKISKLPYSRNLRLLYRMIYPPADVGKLYQQHKVAFEYLFQQSCNDLKLERFSPSIDQEAALKLSALHLVEYVHTNFSKSHDNSLDAKVYIKLVKKTPGLEFFVPASMAESVTDKKGKKIAAQYKKLRSRLTEQIKKNFEEFDFEPPKVKSTTNLNCYSTTSFHELSVPEMQIPSNDHIKLLFLGYLSQLPCYNSSGRPIRSSTSPVEQASTVDCSSSLESVPRTSDSSPLIRQDRVLQSNAASVDNSNFNNISRLAQMNSMRTTNSSQIRASSQAIDQQEMAQTPSIESISSITFNSPSPQQTQTSYISHQGEYPTMAQKPTMEPSPMPRSQLNPTRLSDQNSIEKLYGQRYRYVEKPLTVDSWRGHSLVPSPPSSANIFDNFPHQIANRRIEFSRSNHNTQILSDLELNQLIVPPPPKMFN